MVQWGRDAISRRLTEVYVLGNRPRAAIDLYGVDGFVSRPVLWPGYAPADSAADRDAIGRSRRWSRCASSWPGRSARQVEASSMTA